MRRDFTPPRSVIPTLRADVSVKTAACVLAAPIHSSIIGRIVSFMERDNHGHTHPR